MRTLLGGVVGLVLGAALIAALSVFTDVKSLWPVLPAGVLAGLAMRGLGTTNVSSYLRGAVAAAATAAAAVVGPMVAATWLTNQTGSAAPVVARQAASDDAAESTATDGASEELEDDSQPDRLAAIPSGPQALRTRVESPFGDLSTIASLAFGCLIAYQLGKGKASPYDVQQVADDDAPAPVDHGPVAEEPQPTA